MGKFNFEDYRQPWETGPHWELKREFMEKYSDMFSEDRLLCLAQAYSNIVLMHCSYPDPVMRQISLLSKPLQMRKRFQEGNTAEVEKASKSQPQKVKRKYVQENSGKPCKFIKFCASEEQETTSTLSSNSTILDENVLKEPVAVCYSRNSAIDSLLNSDQQAKSDSIVADIDKNQNDVNSNILIKEDKYHKIASNLGLEFIQNFVQEVRNFQNKLHTAAELILCAAQKLKIYSQICFKIDSIPDCPSHAPKFCSEFSINNCIISSEQEGSKKKAKAKSAEIALDILMKICEENISGINTINSSPTLSISDIRDQKCMDIENSSALPEKYAKTSTNLDAVNADMKMLQTFSENIVNRPKIENIAHFMHIARSLNLENYIAFDITESSKSSQVSEYACNFFLRNILISSGKDANLNNAKVLALKSGCNKLQNLTQYEIQNSELKEKQTNSYKPSNSFAPDSMKIKVKNFQNLSFILNHTLFESSIRDGLVLLDKLSLTPVAHRNVRTIISDSASFCHKPFEYKFEEIIEANSLSRKACVLIGGEIVATGIALTKDEAKMIACNKAIDVLRTKYYTLKIKNEYIDGYIISRNQVFEGESFSSNVVTENNIGCKMLKSMGWTGGGLGTSGIAEPVEAQGHHSFGRGLGYGKDKNDVALFKKRIDSMLQDYSKTNTLSDLVFSKEFTKDERKEIHKIARKYNLHAASRGINEERFLTVRHKYTVIQVLTYLAKNGGSNSKFELVDGTYEKIDV